MTFIGKTEAIPTYHVMDSEGNILDPSQEPEVSGDLSILYPVYSQPSKSRFHPSLR
ncbi:hypothetical protein K493DRAFT_312946 [Basidiobolus meristosporus CBS 931.73]|uniref:Uncharacterized protein n=1 Tax=Basidiobolus meristosporus CBS 931.73 TaxID=1314790 RepID=A0A1Y1YQW6_9FUNG|nr:hypothetical protein K493DRAFT_312946 [Basidiobolus meristosporus CBS 931.73]|eukprot:ORY00137.1 hypothetical protein K493DRAFT_312946 [Basidiobolus meristosporus CBS 931.73]